jgi:hypothetical protein
MQGRIIREGRGTLSANVEARRVCARSLSYVKRRESLRPLLGAEIFEQARERDLELVVILPV